MVCATSLRFVHDLEDVHHVLSDHIYDVYLCHKSDQGHHEHSEEETDLAEIVHASFVVNVGSSCGANLPAVPTLQFCGAGLDRVVNSEARGRFAAQL